MASPNIVLIVVDSLRKDHLGCYGYDRETSPNIDQFAEEKAESCYACFHSSLYSHASMFSGELPSEHEVVKEEDYYSGKNVMVETLKNRGYTTIGVSNNPFLSDYFGLNKGFDRFSLNLGNETDKSQEVQQILRKWRNKDNRGGFLHKTLHVLKESGLSPSTLYGLLLYKLDQSTRFAGLTDSGGKLTLEQLQKGTDDADKPFFLFTNLMEVHSHYLPPLTSGRKYAGWRIAEKPPVTGGPMDSSISDEELEKRLNYYDDSIRYVDTIIGQFVRALKRKYPDTVFIITSDHGELFYDNENEFEDKSAGHTQSFSDKLLNVPFIVYGADNLLSDDKAAFSLDSLPEILSTIADSESFEPDGIAVSECYDEKEGLGRMIADRDNKLIYKRGKTYRVGDEEYIDKLEKYNEACLKDISRVNTEVSERQNLEEIDI